MISLIRLDQNKFCKLDWFCRGVLVIIQLLTRCRDFRVSFVYKLLNGLVDLPKLLNKVTLVIPSFNLRKLLTLETNFHSRNYDHASPLDRVLRIIHFVNDVDPLHCILSELN